MSALKRTALYDVHVQLNARIVEFGGFLMPVQYTGILEEHRRVRESVGVFDVSHMGEVFVNGKDALAYLQSVTINDVSRLHPGRVQYSAMCYENGGIVDDLLVYHLGDAYMLVINAANTPKDLAWLREHLRGDVTLVDRSDDFTLIAVQGPRSLETLQKLTQIDLASLQYYHCTKGILAGVDMIISRTGYTGELGYELYFSSDVKSAEGAWHAIMQAGEEFGIGPVGLGARDTLRLEMGFCLYGNDIDQTTNPVEAGLGWITKTDKGQFVGRDAIAAMKQKGPRRKLVGFTLQDKGFPRHGYPLLAGGREVGVVTSGTVSPVLAKGIGMGYIEVEFGRPGTEIAVGVRGRPASAAIVPLPFIAKK